jgi:chaperone required for assembly of F1-ATPase
LKRFWKEAAPVVDGSGWGIELDGKPVRTPARNPLVVPTQPLAQAIAREWNNAGETIDPRSMPLTGLANAAIDRVAPDTEGFAAGVAVYAESDLLCYRAEAPRELLGRQEAAWDELLAWGRRRFDVDFETTCGIVHVAQPDATVRQLAHAVASLDEFRLAAVSPLVAIGGSLLAALAILEGRLRAEGAWALVTIDEQWQREQWGEDADAEAALEDRRRDFLAAAGFLDLLNDQ